MAAHDGERRQAVTYEEAVSLVNFLNERFRRAKMTPWYLWAVDIDWSKLQRWARHLGWQRMREMEVKDGS